MKVYGDRLRITVLDEENRFLIENMDESLSIVDIAAEFGLDHVADFIGRHERAGVLARNGKPLPPLATPFAGRPKWRSSGS